ARGPRRRNLHVQAAIVAVGGAAAATHGIGIGGVLHGVEGHGGLLANRTVRGAVSLVAPRESQPCLVKVRPYCALTWYRSAGVACDRLGSSASRVASNASQSAAFGSAGIVTNSPWSRPASAASTRASADITRSFHVKLLRKGLERRDQVDDFICGHHG